MFNLKVKEKGAKTNMNIIFVEVVGIIVNQIFVINYKKNYYVTNGKRIEAGRAFAIYEYEVFVNGIKSVLINKGPCFWAIRKNVSCRILVHKVNPNKVAGYSDYMCHLVLMVIFAVCMAVNILVDISRFYS